MSLKVLLVNPPIYDYRYTWEKWHQPVSLLKLATYLNNIGAETRLFNFLAAPHGSKVRRELVNKYKIEGFVFRKYRIGATKTDFYNTLKYYKNSGWVPQELWMSTLTVYWWPGLLEARDIALRVFPDLKVKIGGLYPTLFPEHAEEKFDANSNVKGSDLHNLFYNGDSLCVGNNALITGHIPQVCLIRQDYRLLSDVDYAVFQVRCGVLTDSFVGDLLLPGGRHQFKPVSEIYNDIAVWNKELGIIHFTCFDDKIAADDRGHTLRLLLKEIIKNQLKLKLHFINGLYPEDIDEELAGLLKDAGTLEIYFMPSVAKTVEERRSVYESVVISLTKAGFKLRNLSIGGYFFVGAPEENLVKVLEDGLLISHTLGFAIPVFYTPSPWTKNFIDISNTLDVDELSPHLFPLRYRSPLDYHHYDEIIRLFAMLNYPAKSTTFDFFGEGKVATALRNVIRQNIFNQVFSSKRISRAGG